MRRSIALVLAVTVAPAPCPAQAQAQARILVRQLAPSFAFGVQAPAPMAPAISLPSLGRLASPQAVAMSMTQVPDIAVADSALTAIQDDPAAQKTAEDGIEYADLENRSRFDGESLTLQETVSAPDGYATRSIVFKGSLPSPAELARAVEASKVAPPEIQENLSIKEYKVPKDLIRGLRLRRAGFWASRVIGASAMALSIGLPAFIGVVTLTLLAASALPSMMSSNPGSSELPKEEQNVLKFRAMILVDQLVRRSGSVVGFPRVLLSNIRGRDNASISYFRGNRRYRTFGETLHIGDDYAARDDKALASTIAHELGHLYYPSSNRSNSFDNAREGKGRRVFLGLAGLGFVITKIAAALIFSGAPNWLELTVFGVPSFWWSGMTFCLGALALLAVRFLTLADQRIKELLADHFAGWLTPSIWLADYFRPMQARATRHDQGWRKYLFDHPPYEQRIRRLEAMAAPK